MSPGRLVLLASTLFATSLLATTGFAQEDAVSKDIEELKKGQREILVKLEEIKKLVQAGSRPSGPDVAGKVFAIGDNPTRGSKTAKLTLVEFTDYQWPFCAKYVRETYPQIEKDFISNGKLRYALVDMPLDNHKLAFKAAEVTHCAGDQGKYWEMHDRLIENQKALEPWAGHATALGLDAAKFDACLASGKHAAAIRADLEVARAVGVTATPSFLLAETDPKDPTKVKGLMLIRGAKPYEAFKADLEKALGN